MSSYEATATNAPPDISQRKVALVAGIGLLLMAILAPIAQFGVFPALIVPNDAATTVSNLTASNGLFRIGIALFLVVAFLDVLMAWALYMLLRSVNQPVALLTGMLRLAAAAVLLSVIANLFDAAQLLGGPERSLLPATQLEVPVMASIASFNNGFDIMLAVFGLHLVGVGALVYRSVQFPRILGILVAVAGAGYLADTFTRILVPGFTFTFSLITFVGEALLIVAFLWRAARGFVPEAGSGDELGRLNTAQATS